MFFAHPSSLLRRACGVHTSAACLQSSAASRQQHQRRLFSASAAVLASSSSGAAAPSSPAASRSGGPVENLRTVALSELHKEVLRDEGEGAKSVAPEAPPGWRVSHEPGSRWLLMRRLRPSEMVGGLSSAPPTHASMSAMQYKGHLNKGRPMAASSGGGQAGGAGDRHKRSKFLNGFWSSSVPSASASPMDVEVYVPFATHDPSLFDNSIDVCEWQPFDVVCSKAAVGRGGGGGVHETALLFRLAAVNSQLRVRSIQALTPAAAREIGGTDGGIGVFAGYGPSADYRRRLAYQGPRYSALSSELRACAEDFIAHDIGIDDLVLEYILQTAYISENEEYQRWLHDMALFAGGGVAQ